MSSQKYAVNQPQIEILLSWIKSGEIAIPEIQRPFVWKATNVRDFIDSLYKGYPVGFLITWRNPDIKDKNGVMTNGKRILIDGQQRVTALMTALLGVEILTKDYKKTKIRIAFNPKEERFEVTNPPIEKDKEWISDISVLFDSEFDIFSFINKYIEENEGESAKNINDTLDRVRKIVNRQIGVIELNQDLTIEEVADIFQRINSKGITLNQADFAMSKIASTEKFDGPNIRKAIDIFCHLSKNPEFYDVLIRNDVEFTQTEFFSKMSWLKNKQDSIYIPTYTDMLRVAFTFKFNRGKFKDLVSLLAGRNFETRSYEESISERSFIELKQGLLDFMNESHFKRFVMIIRSAGFITPRLIRSQSAVNASYMLYLKLKELDFPPEKIEKYVRKWYVLSTLTKRYSSSPESTFDYDIKRMNADFEAFFHDTEAAVLSNGFWEAGLIQGLTTSVASSVYFNVFLASQVKANARGFLSKDITVRDMLLNRGDYHHIFPKQYLINNGFHQTQYNQIANYVLMQTEINIKVGKKAPKEYFAILQEQIRDKQLRLGNLTSQEELEANLDENAIPIEILDMGVSDYDEFLLLRRKLIAEKIRKYYHLL